jgi:hypothetical protein
MSKAKSLVVFASLCTKFQTYPDIDWCPTIDFFATFFLAWESSVVDLTCLRGTEERVHRNQGFWFIKALIFSIHQQSSHTQILVPLTKDAEIGLETLEYRQKEPDMMLVYKVMTGLGCWWIERSGSIYQEQTTMEQHGQDLQQGASTLRHPLVTLIWEKNFFTVRVRKEWNRIPVAVRASKTPNSFKIITSGANIRGDG